MKASCIALLGLVAAGPFAASAQTIAEPVTVTSEDKFPVSRWMYGQGEAPKGSSAQAMLAQVKRAMYAEDYEGCVKSVEAVRPKAKSLQAWLAFNEIECATRLKGSDKLAAAIDRIEKNPAWIVKGPQSAPLRTVLIRGYLALLEHDVKSNRARAWRSIESLQELQPYMDDKMKAKMWRSASEIAFLQQKPEAAREFIRRSLAEVESDELKLRLSAIDSAIGPSPGAAPTGAGKEARAVNPILEVSKEELELVERVTTALKSGDLVPAVTDAAKIIRNFPGGTRAKWASDRILETIVSLSDKTDPKYTYLREQMMKQLDSLDGERLGEWSRAMYNRGQFEESFQLARKSLASLAGARSTAILDLGAKAAQATERFETALEMFTELALRHAGTTAAREAYFRAGLLHYRLNQLPQAVASFEKLIALPASDAVEVIGRYWLWRALQKAKSDNAPAAAEELIRRFPFSYYGLRARLETNAGVLEWKPEKKKIESKMWLTGRERVIWEKIQLLLKAGWLEEAQDELREMPAPVRADDKAVRALLLAAAGSFAQASKLANEAWDEKSDLRRTPFVESAFPADFESFVAAQAETRKLERYLVRGLIKQESSFNLKATSSAGALGLMQMMPATAKEIAADLKLGTLAFPEDMYQPARNIQMGTYYLSRMVSRYQGHVPLALAAYNAGPARVDRWLRARPSLKELAKSRSSAPDDEMWIDELPYWETSFYVKAILRNQLIYKMLDQGRVESANPLWAAETVTAKP